MTSERNPRSDNWADNNDDADSQARASRQPLSREEAALLKAQQPSVSPWAVVAAQAGLGVVVALLAALLTGSKVVALSALYGAATVVIPGALMARGMTSRLSSLSPGASAGSFMVWEMTKIAVAVAMLMLAPRLVQPLSWPALLVAMVLCMKVYWLALLWRGRVKKQLAQEQPSHR
jgi:ATP synthase protein I